MSLSDLKLLVVPAVLAGFTALVTDYLKTELPGSRVLATILVGIVSTVLLIGYVLKDRISLTRYAVEVFVLSKDDLRLLVVWHPKFKRYIPPGGRLSAFELPHEAARSKVEQKTGLRKFEFDPRFHATVNEIEVTRNHVIQVPEPYIVQRELRPQRGFVTQHYDFFYVCQATDPTLEHGPNTSRFRPKWVSLDEIKHDLGEEGPFPDAIDKYVRILERVKPSTLRMRDGIAVKASRQRRDAESRRLATAGG